MIIAIRPAPKSRPIPASGDLPDISDQLLLHSYIYWVSLFIDRWFYSHRGKIHSGRFTFSKSSAKSWYIYINIWIPWQAMSVCNLDLNYLPPGVRPQRSYMLCNEMVEFDVLGNDSWCSHWHTWYLSRTPRVYSCKFFLANVNFYRFNAKNWQLTV